MQTNPYAPPQAQDLPLTRATEFGEPQPWTPVEVIQTAWERAKPHLGLFIVAGLISWAVEFVFSAVNQVAGGLAKESPLVGIGLVGGVMIANLLFTAFYQVGMCRLALAAARGRTPEFGTLFSGGDRFLVFWGVGLLAGLAIIFGFVALIIPGILLALIFSQTNPLIADTSLGVMDVLRTSSRITRGQRGQIFVFMLANFGLVMLGVLACCIGLLFVIPVIQVAVAIVYLRLTGQDPGLRPPNDGWGQAPPGYGPQGYGPQGYGPQGYGPQGYGPQGYGPPGNR